MQLKCSCNEKKKHPYHLFVLFCRFHSRFSIQPGNVQVSDLLMYIQYSKQHLKVHQKICNTEIQNSKP